jgi:DNA polymerase III epsilon subunit-like protein
MVREAPTWPDVWPRVYAALRDRHIGIYSAGFDLQVLRGCTVRAGIPWRRIETAFCILKLYAAFRGEPKDPYGNPAWHRLEAAGRACGVSVSNLHRALSDALLAREVLHYIAREPIAPPRQRQHHGCNIKGSHSERRGARAVMTRFAV